MPAPIGAKILCTQVYRLIRDTWVQLWMIWKKVIWFQCKWPLKEFLIVLKWNREKIKVSKVDTFSATYPSFDIGAGIRRQVPCINLSENTLFYAFATVEVENPNKKTKMINNHQPCFKLVPFEKFTEHDTTNGSSTLLEHKWRSKEQERL